MIFLGQDTGEIKIDKVKYVLDHPGGGSAQGLSYKPQKRIEIIDSHNKPKVLLIGHYHKSYAFSYRNVQCVEVPSLCAKTQFQQNTDPPAAFQTLLLPMVVKYQVRLKTLSFSEV